MKQINYLSKKMLFAFFFILFSLGFSQKQGLETKIFHTTKAKSGLVEHNGVIRCASTPYEEYLQKKYPERLTNDDFEAWIKPIIEKQNANGKSQSGGIITIPVVVHVIHSGQPIGVAPNITDNQVISQITVMNQDFRKMMGTPGFNTNAVGADTQIQFALAKVDPNGNPTNGIHRVNLCQNSWSVDDMDPMSIDNFVKPTTIWDPTMYMNMWSVNFSDGSLLGYAQFPSNSGLQGLNANGGLANTDGVVANYATFGSSDYNDGSFILAAPYDKGRTMTHEVGHFLGLRHIWGDDASSTVCATDYCDDTPPAHKDNYTCNTSIPSCTTGLFEMVQNYMDYTNDSCMNIFTINQKDRITAVMNNSPRRLELKNSTKDIAIPLFANDAELLVEGICDTSAASCNSSLVTLTITNRGTATLTSAGISYSVSGAPFTYNWTGSLAPNKSNTYKVPVTGNVPSGPISASITSVNGGVDQRSTNNTASGAYTTLASPTSYNFTTVVLSLQLDNWGSETTWYLENSSGAIVASGGPYTDSSVLPSLISQTFTLNLNDCYTFKIFDSYGDGICCTGGNGYFNLKDSTGTTTIYSGGTFTTSEFAPFRLSSVQATSEVENEQFAIFPNPASETLHIKKASEKATYSIYDNVGRLVSNGKVQNGIVKISTLLKGTYVIKIEDKGKSSSKKFIKK